MTKLSIDNATSHCLKLMLCYSARNDRRISWGPSHLRISRYWDNHLPKHWIIPKRYTYAMHLLAEGQIMQLISLSNTTGKHLIIVWFVSGIRLLKWTLMRVKELWPNLSAAWNWTWWTHVNILSDVFIIFLIKSYTQATDLFSYSPNEQYFGWSDCKWRENIGRKKDNKRK